MKSPTRPAVKEKPSGTPAPARPDRQRVPGAAERVSPPPPASRFGAAVGNLPVVSAPPAGAPAGLAARPRHPRYVVFKAVLEWAVAMGLAVVAVPVVLLLAAVVKLTSAGPAFYAQTRAGRNGRTFMILKIRTMTHGCEAATGAVWSGPHDPRITRVGRFLRDTHLDELPQLFNVLSGAMGLVGPRPERPEIAGRLERALPDYANRLLVRPGITGLAQMQVPADSDAERLRLKLAHDLYYVRHVNLMLDVRIVLCTAFYLFRALADALCNLLVKSYGTEAARDLDRLPALNSEDCPATA